MPIPDITQEQAFAMAEHIVQELTTLKVAETYLHGFTDPVTNDHVAIVISRGSVPMIIDGLTAVTAQYIKTKGLSCGPIKNQN